MSHTGILTRVEIESMGPPVLEELREADVPASFLCDLALKHVAQMPEPTTRAISEELRLPRALVEEMLVHLSREKMIEVKGQIAVGATRYAMLDRGWDRVARVRDLCGYVGPAPVSLRDYAHMMRLQAVPARAASVETVRAAFRDLVLPESLIQTMGCVINSRRSLFITARPGRARRPSPSASTRGCPATSGSPTPSRWTARSSASSTTTTTGRRRPKRRPPTTTGAGCSSSARSSSSAAS